MSIYVRDKATDGAVRRLAQLKGKSLTETIRETVDREYEREREKTPLRERIEALIQRVKQYPPTGLEADKAFFDELSGGI